MPAGESSGLARDAILGRLARQAIAERPGLYLKTGMTKFVGEIGQRPYRLGFLSGAYNPLNRQELLPSPIEKLVGYQPRPSRWISALLRQIHEVSVWLYALMVYLAFLTFAAIVFLRVSASIARRKLVAKREAIAKRLLVAGMFSGGVVALVVVAVPGRSTVDFVITSALCLMLLVLFLKVMNDRSSDDRVLREGTRLADARAYVLWFALYFGSLWFSWQVDSVNSRNVLLYLPVLAAVVGGAIAFWRRELSYAVEGSVIQERGPRPVFPP
jgi:hypothetical protein